MLKWTVEDAPTGVPTDPMGCNKPDFEVSCCGIVGLSGSSRGSIVVNFSASVAMAATAELFGAPSLSFDSNVIDTVGELTNIIGGSSKDKLGRDGLLLGLPTVIVGKEQSIGFDHGVQMDLFLFKTPHGNFTVEIALGN